MKTPPHKLVSKSFKTPKGCHIRYVELRSGSTAKVGYDCGDGGSMEFPLPEGPGVGNYPSAIVKGVRSVHVPGTTVDGIGASIGFVLSPDHVTCSKTASSHELSCKLHKAGGQVLAGTGRRRKRR